MTQLLLFPDPRPLVERLGAAFFRDAPQTPGVYLMRDPAGSVLYVGKAKNLKKRLAHYRVANPDRVPRRHLRLLREVARIDLEECADEVGAFAREAELLRSLRPRFNRAGIWPGPARFIAWRRNDQRLELAVRTSVDIGWFCHGPVGMVAFAVRAALARLLWCVVHASETLPMMPEGWFAGRHSETTILACGAASSVLLAECESRLGELFAAKADAFAEWIRGQTPVRNHPFGMAVIEADLEVVCKFAAVGVRRRHAVQPVRECDMMESHDGYCFCFGQPA